MIHITKTVKSVMNLMKESVRVKRRVDKEHEQRSERGNMFNLMRLREGICLT